MSEVYLSIGGNLGNRKQNLEKCKSEIDLQIGQIQQESSIYESEAWGFDHPRNFYNQVISIQTDKNTEDILRIAQGIEKDLGRIRSEHKAQAYEGRTMDIDILLIDDLIINSEKLIVPHPHMHERNFVIIPLTEIAPQFIHPVLNKDIATLEKQCQDKGSIQKLHTKTLQDE